MSGRMRAAWVPVVPVSDVAATDCNEARGPANEHFEASIAT